MRKHIVISVIGDERLQGLATKPRSSFFLSRQDYELLQYDQLDSVCLPDRQSKTMMRCVVDAVCEGICSGTCKHMFAAINRFQVSDFTLDMRSALKGCGVSVEHISPHSLARHNDLLVIRLKVFQSCMAVNAMQQQELLTNETYHIIDQLRLATNLAYVGYPDISDVGFA
jgi:hypothetical protein